MGCNTSQEKAAQGAPGDVTGNDEKKNEAANLKIADDNTLNGELLGKDVEEAAVKIQAVFRGHKVRAANMKSSDMSSNKPTQPTSNNAPPVPANQAQSEPTKEELEAEFREDDKALCDAATRIQATFRGHMSRKIASGGNAEQDLQEITQKVAEELDIDLGDPELNKAATKIQASFRGHKARQKDKPEN